MVTSNSDGFEAKPEAAIARTTLLLSLEETHEVVLFGGPSLAPLTLPRSNPSGIGFQVVLISAEGLEQQSLAS